LSTTPSPLTAGPRLVVILVVGEIADEVVAKDADPGAVQQNSGPAAVAEVVLHDICRGEGGERIAAALHDVADDPQLAAVRVPRRHDALRVVVDVVVLGDAVVARASLVEAERDPITVAVDLAVPHDRAVRRASQHAGVP
jgi:hypothetical protein